MIKHKIEQNQRFEYMLDWYFEGDEARFCMFVALNTEKTVNKFLKAVNDRIDYINTRIDEINASEANTDKTIPYFKYLFSKAAEDYKPLINKLLKQAKSGDEKALKELQFLNDFFALSYNYFQGEFKDKPKEFKKEIYRENYVKKNDVYSKFSQVFVEPNEYENFQSSDFKTVCLSERQIEDRAKQEAKNQKQTIRRKAS